MENKGGIVLWEHKTHGGRFFVTKAYPWQPRLNFGPILNRTAMEHVRGLNWIREQIEGISLRRTNTVSPFCLKVYVCKSVIP